MNSPALKLSSAKLPSLTEVEAEIARRSLREFQRRAWKVVEPSTRYIPNWHIDAIADHLTAVLSGDIRRLLINVPPRCEKSLNVSVFWPAWAWIDNPSLRWLFTSYGQELATRDSLKCRRLIQSKWYQDRWGDVFRLTSDQNVKTRFENDKTGYRVATSVGGMGTGEGGSVVVADDPHNVKEGESEVKRESTLLWWDEVMSTRLDDPKTGALVIVMQRVHDGDLAGHVLAQGGYEHLCLPMEYEGTACVTVLGKVDPRTEDGELLWPERFGATEVEDLKLRMGPYAAAGQLQQRPSPRRGGMFERDWFEIVESAPSTDMEWVRYWDKAGTAGGGKFTAGVLIGRHVRGTYYVKDVVRGQWAAAVREPRIKGTTQLDGQTLSPYTVYIEQEPGSGGKDSVIATITMLEGYAAFADPPTGDKLLRAEPLAAQAKAGNIKIVRGAWNEAFLREFEMCGPKAEYMDQVDATAGGFNKLAKKHGRQEAGVSPGGATRASPWRNLR